jgi:ATP-dependent exoDNAse (exonuclease V) beta subunit
LAGVNTQVGRIGYVAVTRAKKSLGVGSACQCAGKAAASTAGQRLSKSEGGLKKNIEF